MRSLPIYGHVPEGESIAVTRKGFRLFFLLGALFAVVIMPVWLLTLRGMASPAEGYWAFTIWHTHEMVFGFTVAVIAGFLLTAVSNWTARETATGGWLVGLAAVWGLGRVVMSLGMSRGLSPIAIALADLAFIPALGVAIGRPILATKNRRNLVMLALLGLLFVGNVLMHADALVGGPFAGLQRRAVLFSVDLVILLTSIITARVVPMFTKNALKGEASPDSIRSSKALDVMVALTLGSLAIVDIATNGEGLSAKLARGLSVLGGLSIIVRASGWFARPILKHPMLWILHAGHGFIALGLLLRAASPLLDVPESIGTHALTVGAIGSLTLGMMARVTLGHTGRSVHEAPPLVILGFVGVVVAALVRLGGFFVPTHYALTLLVAGGLWTVAFGLFLAAQGRMLVRPRIDDKPA